MTIDPKKIVAAINPDIYCLKHKEQYEERTDIRQQVKDFITKSFKDWDEICEKEKKHGLTDEEKKEKQKIAENVSRVYINATKIPDMNLIDSQVFDFDAVIKRPIDDPPPGFKNPIEQHTVSYETSGQSVEQIYFWIHDYLFNQKNRIWKCNKIG